MLQNSAYYSGNMSMAKTVWSSTRSWRWC